MEYHILNIIILVQSLSINVNLDAFFNPSHLAVILIETNTIIKSKQTKHWQEETHTHTHTSAQPEWIIIFKRIPSISCFKKC